MNKLYSKFQPIWFGYVMLWVHFYKYIKNIIISIKKLILKSKTFHQENKSKNKNKPKSRMAFNTRSPGNTRNTIIYLNIYILSLIEKLSKPSNAC